MSTTRSSKKPKKKPVKRASVARPRNAGTMTEAEFFSKIRSALRKAFQYWKPMAIALENSARPYKGPNKRQKKEYQCNECKSWFPRSEVEVDHITPCGSLRTYEDIVPFLLKLTPEDVSKFQVLCKEHHKVKTQNERKTKNEVDTSN